jgi:hypothetical protein
MKLFQLSITALIIRFYILMAIVVVAGFSGLWLLSLLALPVFFSGLLGVQFNRWGMKKKASPAGHSLLQHDAGQVAAHA